MAAGRRRGRPGGSSSTVGRGGCGGGSACANNGLTDRQRKVLPFSGPPPDPTTPVHLLENLLLPVSTSFFFLTRCKTCCSSPQ